MAILPTRTTVDTNSSGDVNSLSTRATDKNDINAKGDIFVGTADDTLSRLGVGANEKILIADSGEATGLKWGLGVQESNVYAYLSGASQTINDITQTKVQLDAEEWDGLGEFDPTTNYRFTATNAGIYLVTGYAWFNSLLDQELAQIDFRLNGSATGTMTMRNTVSGNNSLSYTITNYMNLSANDYLELWVFINVAAASKTIAGRASSTALEARMMIQRVV